jgi:hypothetical protein
MLSTLLSLLIGLVLSLSILAGGLFCGYTAVTTLKSSIQLWTHSRRSKGWPVVEGSVVRAAIREEPSRTYINRIPEVEYRYVVLGTTYQGNRILFDSGERYAEQEAEKILAGYAQGTTVQVHYDPNDPQESVLEQKARGLGTSLGVICALLFVATFGIAIGSGMLIGTFRPQQ